MVPSSVSDSVNAYIRNRDMKLERTLFVLRCENIFYLPTFMHTDVLAGFITKQVMTELGLEEGVLVTNETVKARAYELSEELSEILTDAGIYGPNEVPDA